MNMFAFGAYEIMTGSAFMILVIKTFYFSYQWYFFLLHFLPMVSEP